MGRTLRAEEERRREGAGGEGTGEAAAEASGSSVQRHHLGQQAYERLRGGHEQCEARLSQVCAKGQALQRGLRRSGFAYHWTLAWGVRCPLRPCPTTALGPDCFPWDQAPILPASRCSPSCCYPRRRLPASPTTPPPLPPARLQVLTEASTLAMQVDPASRTLVLRSMLPPSGAATNDLWAALAARGQLEDRLRLMAGA